MKDRRKVTISVITVFAVVGFCASKTSNTPRSEIVILCNLIFIIVA